MNKTPATTVRYAAKQAYQLFLTRGLSSSSIAGHFCTIFARKQDHYVAVHGVEDKHGNFSVVRVPVAKSWASL